MKESYGEGLATHTGPESCAAARKGGGEALTGERAGRVLSRETNLLRECRRRGGRRKATPGASLSRDAAELPRGQRPRACTETPRAGTGRSRGRPSADGAAGRIGKSKDVRR